MAQPEKKDAVAVVAQQTKIRDAYLLGVIEEKKKELLELQRNAKRVEESIAALQQQMKGPLDLTKCKSLDAAGIHRGLHSRPCENCGWQQNCWCRACENY